jgi:hypothetical protein
MPAPLSVPRVPPGFPLLAAAGSQTAHPGGPTAPETKAAGQTMSPGGQTTPGTEANDLTVSPDGPTATLGGSTARPCSAPSSPGSPTLATPRAAPMTSAAPPCSALDSTRTTHSPSVNDSGHTTHASGVPALPALIESPSNCAGATGTTSTSAVAVGEGCTSDTSGQPSFDDHAGEATLLASSR